MKNLLHNIPFRIILALIMAGVQSCTDDTPEMSQAEVSFTATLPADARSRSFGDAEQVNTLVVGVFDEQKVEIYRRPFAITGTTVDFQLTLAQSQTYNLVFWAHNDNQDIYKIDDLTAIQMKDLPNPITFVQAEARDAFFAIKENITVTGNRNYSIELVRPLAQINIGATGTPMYAQLTAADAPNTFHPFTNTVSGAADFTWKFNETTTETFSADGQEYKYLGVGYLFAPPTTAKSIEVELALTDGINIAREFKFPQVEIKANHRSNLIGHI